MSSENNFSVVNNAEDVSGRKMSFHFGLNDDDNGGDLPIEDPKGKDVSAPCTLQRLLVSEMRKKGRWLQLLWMDPKQALKWKYCY